MVKKKYCITFAGVAGIGKSPIANFLSCSLNLPIICNDAIRNEVKEDFLFYNIGVFENLRSKRLQSILNQGIPFIMDASVDRRWPNLKIEFLKSNYKVFIISINLGKRFIKKLYTATGNEKSEKYIDTWLADHFRFCEEFKNDVNLNVNESNYSNRMELSLHSVKDWINQ